MCELHRRKMPRTAELSWFTPAGTPMTSGDWSDPNALAVGIYLDGSDDPDGNSSARDCVASSSITASATTQRRE